MQIKDPAMTYVRLLIPLALMAIAGGVSAQTPGGVKPYISEDSPFLVLDHVRIIEGVTSFKAHNSIKADELTAIEHAHSLKITGHLCSVGPLFT